MMTTTILTGASGGVALALAERLRARGDRLVLISRQVAALQPSANDLVIEADVSTYEGAQAAFASVKQQLGAPAAYFAHCVGNTVIAPISRTKPEQYRSCMAANIDSAFFSAQAFLAQAIEAQQPAAMVLFSSVVAGIGVTNHAAISAAKGAIESMTRALAADYAAAQIRINCIAPGLMRTPMTAKMLVNESSERQIAAQYPLGGFGAAADAASAAEYLLSDAARWITGQILHLDGGFSAIRPYVKV
jgi:NAD(P)-dependent dehydrogenase (short-subunit alcohol dehydrogenase family)